jgi:hypothetical protein
MFTMGLHCAYILRTPSQDIGLSVSVKNSRNFALPKLKTANWRSGLVSFISFGHMVFKCCSKGVTDETDGRCTHPLKDSIGLKTKKLSKLHKILNPIQLSVIKRIKYNSILL